jgi:hypothetical protein
MRCSSKQHVKNLKGKAFDITVLLDYQDDAVVSREIIKKTQEQLPCSRLIKARV